MKKIPLLLLAFALSLGVPRAAVAQAEPFIGQIAWVAFNFNPRGWANCDGQLLAISQNQALFSLLGTMYGGDGRTTFGLPDMRGRVPIHLGNGPGLTPYSQGQKGGVESVTLQESQIPSHSHGLAVSTSQGNRAFGFGNQFGMALFKPESGPRVQGPVIPYRTPENPPDELMDPRTIANTGGSQPHTNIQPFNTIRCIIALEGLFPSRN